MNDTWAAQIICLLQDFKSRGFKSTIDLDSERVSLGIAYTLYHPILGPAEMY